MIAWGAHIWLMIGVIIMVRALGRPEQPQPIASLGIIAIASLVVLAGEFALARVGFYEHYFGGVFAPIVLLCWIGAQQLWSNQLTRVVVILPACAIVFSTLLICWMMHRSRSSPDQLGPRITARLDENALIAWSGDVHSHESV